MRVLVQRVERAEVEVDGEIVGTIRRGVLAFISVGKGDSEQDAAFIADKIVNLRIFADRAGKMNLSVQDVGGAVLAVSNFTLHGDCRKGRRPGFDAAADPDQAERLFDKVVALISASVPVGQGRFGARMHVSSVNDGPINFILDSSRLF